MAEIKVGRFTVDSLILAEILGVLQNAVSDSDANVVRDAAISAGLYVVCPACGWVDVPDPDIPRCPDCKGPWVAPRKGD